jgi:hypothetical protein
MPLLDKVTLAAVSSWWQPVSCQHSATPAFSPSLTAGKAAFEFSLNKALIAFGVRSEGRLDALHKCLFATSAARVETWIVVIGIIQMLLSLLLIFLFAHAVRVRFRV